MEKISVNCKELLEIITQLENAFDSFIGFGDGLFDCMIDDESEIYGSAEELLSNSISMLKKLIGIPT